MPPSSARQHQAGIAAIEMSVTLIVLLMLLFGIVSYGALFWAQQSLTNVAADTARHGVAQSYTHPDESADLCAFAQEAANHSILKAFGLIQCASESSAGDAGLRTLTITLGLSVNQWALLNSMRSLAGLFSNAPDSLIPQALHAHATVLIAPETEE